MIEISLTEKILEVLEKENRQTIKQIFEKSGLGKDLDKKKDAESVEKLRLLRENLRNAVIRLSTINKKKKLIKDGMKGREYLYSLRDNAESDNALMKQFYEFQGENMKPREDRKEEIKEKLPLIRKIKERIQ